MVDVGRPVHAAAVAGVHPVDSLRYAPWLGWRFSYDRFVAAGETLRHPLHRAEPLSSELRAGMHLGLSA
jgi:hypothetical protein